MFLSMVILLIALTLSAVSHMCSGSVTWIVLPSLTDIAYIDHGAKEKVEV